MVAVILDMPDLPMPAGLESLARTKPQWLPCTSLLQSLFRLRACRTIA